jgi:hypothetical protein
MDEPWACRDLGLVGGTLSFANLATMYLPKICQAAKFGFVKSGFVLWRLGFRIGYRPFRQTKSFSPGNASNCLRPGTCHTILTWALICVLCSLQLWMNTCGMYATILWGLDDMLRF